MKTYYSRINKKTIDGKVYYQPQVKEKTLLSFLFRWECLSMLILDVDFVLVMWSENKNDVQTKLDRFSYLLNVELEQQ